VKARFLAVLVILSVNGLVQANPTHDQIYKMNESARKAFFLKLFTASKEPCGVVDRVFYQGSDKQGNAYWNVSCIKHEAMQIQIANNSLGSTKVLECSVLKALNKGTDMCFTRF